MNRTAALLAPAATALLLSLAAAGRATDEAKPAGAAKGADGARDDGGKVLFEDPFSGKLAAGWRWLREDPKTHRIGKDGLEIRVEPGLADTVKNALVRPAPDRAKARYAVEVLVTSGARPTNQYEQAGITWYVDGKPAFKVVKELVDGKVIIIPARVPVDSETVGLRVLVEGRKITAQFRPKGTGAWKPAGAAELPPGKDEVSVQCYNGPPAEELWFRFRDFRIVELPPVPAPASPPPGAAPPAKAGG